MGFAAKVSFLLIHTCFSRVANLRDVFGNRSNGFGLVRAPEHLAEAM
jgi:hypothetical protein